MLESSDIKIETGRIVFVRGAMDMLRSSKSRGRSQHDLRRASVDGDCAGFQRVIVSGKKIHAIWFQVYGAHVIEFKVVVVAADAKKYIKTGGILGDMPAKCSYHDGKVFMRVGPTFEDVTNAIGNPEVSDAFDRAVRLLF